MNTTTVSRLAAATPVAVALLGFSIGSAHAAPYEPAASDKVQIQPAGDPPEWDFDLPISDDLPDGDPPPVDPEDVGPAEPDDEPADEPAEDDSDDEGSDSDTGADSGADSDNAGTSSKGGSSKGGGSKRAKDAGNRGDSDEADPPVEAADVQFTPAGARGVQVPTEAVAAAGAALVGVVGWAGYRRMKATASV